MDIREFKEKVFSKASVIGFKEYEIYYCKDDSLSIHVYAEEVDKYSVSTSMGVSFRGIYNGKMGYSYTEILDEEAVEMLVDCAKINAETIENEDEEFIYGGMDKYEIVNCYNSQLSAVSAEEKIKLALSLEKIARSKSSKVVNISYCSVGSNENEYGIFNSKGIQVYHKSNSAFGAVGPVVSDGARKYNGMSYRINNDFRAIDAEIIAEEAVQEALACIGANPVKSGVYKIILRNDVAATLLATFSASFNADNVQKGLSLLKNKIGNKIAANVVNVVDNPHLQDGLASSPFDSEGVATYKKYVIEKGNLTTFLYNLKTAAKDGVKTTGNASKASYSSPVNISPSNFYIEKGVKSLNDLLGLLRDGLLITDLAGTHAGANPVTGDFSLAAKGFVIKNGNMDVPVEQITIAGNFFELLAQVDEIGEDLKFALGGGSGYFGSPSILINSISVAGN